MNYFVWGMFLTLALGSIVAIAVGIVGLRRASDLLLGNRGLAVALLSFGGVGLLVVTPIIFTIVRPALAAPGTTAEQTADGSENVSRPVLAVSKPESANRAQCARNLEALGRALRISSADTKGGRFPQTLEELRPMYWQAALPVKKEDMVCASQGTKASMPYVYAGAKLRQNSPADSVLAYEPLANHNNEGSNVLFHDGHVEWIGRVQVEAMIQAINEGKNPPPMQRR